MDLVEGLFPAGRIHLFGGAAGSGKTTVLAWMLRRMQEGQEVFGRKTRPARQGVYWIAADRPWVEYAEPLTRSGIKLEGWYSFADDHQMTQARFSQADPVPLLQYAFKAIDPKPESIVVVDVLGLFLGDDLRRYRPLMAYLWVYNRWVQDLGITLFGSVHAAKQRGPQDRYVRLFDRVMGAGALRAASATAMYLTTAEETGREKGYQELEIAPRNTGAVVYQMHWDQVDGLLKPKEAIINDTVLDALELVPWDPPGIGSEALAGAITLKLQIGRSKAYELISSLNDDGMIRRLGASQKTGWIRVRGATA